MFFVLVAKWGFSFFPRCPVGARLLTGSQVGEKVMLGAKARAGATPMVVGAWAWEVAAVAEVMQVICRCR